MAASLKARSEPTRGFVSTATIFDLPLNPYFGPHSWTFKKAQKLTRAGTGLYPLPSWPKT